MKKFLDFCQALNNLKDIYEYEEPFTNVVLTGLVALYGICFEQAWKAMKEVLEENGFAEGQTGSPRQILKTAYRAGMIKDERLWLEALVSRNNVEHAYNKAVALDILHAAKEKYFNMFCELKQTIEERWLIED